MAVSSVRPGPESRAGHRATTLQCSAGRGGAGRGDTRRTSGLCGDTHSEAQCFRWCPGELLLRSAEMETKQTGRQGRGEAGTSRKKSKKGILKKSSGQADQEAGSGGQQTKAGGRGSHKNSGGSCDPDSEAGRRAGRRERRERSQPDTAIYDTPKVSSPSVKWKEDLTAAYDIVTKGAKPALISAVNPQVNSLAESACFYENVDFTQQQSREPEEVIYNLPRPRNSDAIYFNENFDDEIPTYDTPRRNSEEGGYEAEGGEYDVPVVREAVLTPIEEEDAQEYDVPRNNPRLVRPSRQQQGEQADCMYENQQFGSQSDLLEEPIYMNELGDDRSSGYRSSSSPSIHSEENLYENGAVLLSSDEQSSQSGSQVRINQQPS